MSKLSVVYTPVDNYQVRNGDELIAIFSGKEGERYAEIFVKALEIHQINERRAADMQAAAGGE
jgi:hypothetical protein